jgi:ketosteroid isomerase-like protein
VGVADYEKKTLFPLVAIFAGASGAFAAGDDVRSAIEAANKAFGATVAQGDGLATAALYTADAQLLPAQSEVVSGTQAIGKFWQGAIDSGVKGATLTTLELESAGNVANEVGQYELRGGDGKVLDRGKYVVIWKKDSVGWKLHRDIWTTSVAPAKP